MRCPVHKYVRGKLGNRVIYKCIICPHYVFEDLIVGRESVCHGCHRVFRITAKNLKAKPHCGCLTDYYLDKYKLRLNNPKIKKIQEDRSDLTSLLMGEIK